ncbi:GtrA family protein [Massilia sp. BJB1822]|uniref:GtrA family protein n=1 Tax=Massilia sp. BJB1822 TaxID=2744470 RepID=UPI001594BE50|nr:GtrA family protein [Massilia sp. BJB1822]NVE01876.1 GtrA family protein [Massilia sp. BJB1822]
MDKLWRQHGQFLTYLLGGVLSAALDIGLLQLLVNAGTPPMLAASCGFAAGLLLNFSYHARLTFKRLADSATFGRYLCVVGANYLLTLACVAASVALWQSVLPGKLLSLPLTAVNGYLLGKRWIFR